MVDHAADQMFAGQGEMARLIRSMDWAETPLGSVDRWPASLRTAVSICLGSRHPIVLWWGPERWMFYNDAYRPMLGDAKHPQFLGAPGKACWAEIWDIIGPMMDQVIETGEATWSEDMFLLMLRHGYLEETYFTFSYSPIRDETGKPCGIFNACTESTARVLSERRMKTLREMTVEARTAGEAATRCAEILGNSSRDIPFARIYLGDGESKRVELAGQAGSSAFADEDQWPLERVAATARGELLDVVGDEATRQAMLLPLGRPGQEGVAGVVVLGINPHRAFDDDYRGFFDLVAGRVGAALSSARALEEERERADKLAELDRVKTEFFSNVSHEFRTPLTLILGPLEDALREPNRVLGGDTLEAVHRNALRLLRLVNSLLDFSRVEADRVEASFEPIDLATLTGGLAGSFQSLLDSAGLKLIVDCPPLGEPVYVDRAQWEKIVLNLISNAFKFTFEGEIKVRLRRHRDGAELSISDTGTGIPAEELPRIFDRFHRVEGARGRSFEGTGIGLALVQELVRQHGGTIRVESVLGTGTSFVVCVPLGMDHLPRERIRAVEPPHGIPAAAAPYLLEAGHWQPNSGEGAVAGARVLIADDNADMRQYLVRLIAPRWNVEAVADGQAALDSALADPPNLVLSDVMMPRMDGVTLLRALRRDPKTSTVPVVLLSARAGEESILAGLDTGADDYLVKPFSARELISRVSTHLEMARVRHELAETRAALLADLERKNRELEAFNYSVSHDLRAPLRGIAGFGGLLVEEYSDRLEGDGLEYLRNIIAATERMNRLVDDMLRLSKLERAELRREHVDLARLARHVAQNLRTATPDHGVELVIHDGLAAEADPHLTEVLMENLLGNAWKFTAKTTAPRVECGWVEKDGQRVFYVRDNGAGFAPHQAHRLFAPFRRLHSEKDFPGTGVGLATVHRIVDRHGGRVWAEGVVDAGATIFWTLPVARPRV